VWCATGVSEVAESTGSRLVQFDSVQWRRLNGSDYYIAKPAFEADLVINIPKLKTHSFARYTGAIKNLFGLIPGARKREAHFRAPGATDFAEILVDILQLAPPALTIVDGVLGQEGNGPGLSGTPRWYNCIAASADPVALDAVIADALGFSAGAIIHVASAGARGLGEARAESVQLVGDRRVLAFGQVRLPEPGWYYKVPSFLTRPLHGAMRLRPHLAESECTGCGNCGEVCPTGAIEPGHPPAFDLDRCVGCMCCSEICPAGAIRPRGNLLTLLAGFGH
jgi:ferredoxin